MYVHELINFLCLKCLWKTLFSRGFPVQPSLSHFYADDVKSINFNVNTKHDLHDL